MWAEPLPLRPHHGLCMAYFVGEGYSGAFSRHMGQVLESLLAGGTVRLVCGVDAVCAACPENLDGLCRKAEQTAGYDRAVLRLCRLSEGTVLPFSRFTALVQERIILPNRRESICGGCQWEGLCTSVESRWASSAPL